MLTKILSYFFTIRPNFFTIMPKSGEIKVAENNSTRNLASAREKGTSYADVRLPVNNPYSIAGFSDFLSELRRHFNAEKDAKNEAYAFILYAGLAEAFGRWLVARHRPGRKSRMMIGIPELPENKKP